MLIKVDWISFSLPVLFSEGETELEALYAAAQALMDIDERLPDWLGINAKLTPSNGRAPYKTGWRIPGHGVTLFTHPNLNHALIEVSGAGCDFLAANEVINQVLWLVRKRVTRIDIACDMVTDTRPLAFVADREPGRFKAHSEVVSESGETAYIGARSSDRYARVYRYNAPHERSHLLRCEYVVKAENAKLLVEPIVRDGLQSVAAALGDAYGWQHEDWNVEANAAELQVYRPDRREGKTLFWLADTVAPLLRRLHAEGVIDVEAWFQENVSSQLNTRR